MGYLVYVSKMPSSLAWILVGGGAGYVLATFIYILTPTTPSSLTNLLAIPASIGEFWMIGYLLFKKSPVL